MDGATTRSSEGNYQGVIPLHLDGTIAQLNIKGTDGAGAASPFPRGGPESRALYRVDNLIQQGPLKPQSRASIALEKLSDKSEPQFA